MTDDEKIQLEQMIEERALEPLGMGIQPDISDKYPSFRISKVMGPQWEDYEYVDWPHYSVTMQVVARPKPHLSLVKENKKMKLTKYNLRRLILEVLEREISPIRALKEIGILVANESPSKETLEELFEYGELGMQYVMSNPEEFDRENAPSQMVRTITDVSALEPAQAWSRIGELAAQRTEDSYEAFQTLRQIVDLGFQAYTHLMEKGEK